MKTIDGIPQIVEGVAYYAHVGKPVPDFTEKQTPGAGKYGWELNLAVSDATYNKFQNAGFNVGLRPAGRNKYTEDNVITFYKYHLDYNGAENLAPVVVDIEKNPFTDMIGNGSKVAVQWAPMSYAKGKYKRPIVNAVQVLDLVEKLGVPAPTFTEDEVAF